MRTASNREYPEGARREEGGQEKAQEKTERKEQERREELVIGAEKGGEGAH